MRHFCLFCLFAVAGAACNKTTTDPVPGPSAAAVKHISLGNQAIAFGQQVSVDIDSNGTADLVFKTSLIGDPINGEDKRQWLVQTYGNARLPVNNADHIPVFHSRQRIGTADFSGYHWSEGVAALLSEKVTTVQDQVIWRGDWVAASHQFIPFLTGRNNDVYTGWVEISFSADQELLILHKAARSTKSNQAIEAGG
ncbi:hypothetical protein [Niabella drilacis]|uniref:Uncharacterized protein n=1 Tax=Niabella drilacis (strain DSM 25811 / CCM 8410 / CCUG 62505 / LMG 26954 / E90) TaxID=1285928 RepID=A0A1G6YTW6_NIADE|nr:hypothetical protein [Niabella drilacis]SDD93849.1 hypothetical protein SAMN04487894_11696 [Niabella drilacis]